MDGCGEEKKEEKKQTGGQLLRTTVAIATV